ncbi:MAG: hypothetical protein VYD37_01825 [Gemmatimonadota bacterium]|nr:hypothetical protein [Gemmatimonadota bacterium]
MNTLFDGTGEILSKQKLSKRYLLMMLILLLAVVSKPVIGVAQDAPPAGIAEIELERSRLCVPVLTQLDELNLQLQPLGIRTERLRQIAAAIAIEDRTVMDSLNVTDPTEAAVRDWFLSDGRLAQSFLDTNEQTIQQQRAVDRELIKGTVQATLEGIQSEAQGIIEDAGDFGPEASSCEGAVLIRSAVIEACGSEQNLICDAAKPANSDGAYRFVDSPEDLWDVQEFRPWTSPGPLQLAPDGQLDGASTVAFARQGNVAFSVAFRPDIRPRTDMAPENIQTFQTLLDSIGFEFNHPELIYAPALTIRATLPEPLAGEDRYAIHFGAIEAGDIIWEGASGTGAPIEISILLTPIHIVKLTQGESLELTAIRSLDDSSDEALFGLALTPVNQVAATQALLAYMATQMPQDLNLLVPPGDY